MIYYKKYKYFQKVQVIMNKKKSYYVFLGQTVLYFIVLLGLLYFFSYLGQSQGSFIYNEKPVPRKKEEEQTEGTGRNSAQNPCYGLLVCTGISYIYCLDFKNKNPGSYFNTSVSLADHY